MSFINLRVTETGYQYAERRGVWSVAFAPYRRRESVCFLNCYHPVTRVLAPRAFTGSNDQGMPPDQVVIHEAVEECGWIVDERNLASMGQWEVGNQTNEVVHLYLVDVTDAQSVPTDMDERERADYAGVLWLPPDHYFHVDWKANLLHEAFARRERP